MKVLWLLSDRSVSSQSVHLSDLASSRYRCSNFLSALDADVTVAPLTNHFPNYSVYDVVVIGKFFAPKVSALIGLIAEQTKVLLDCCDISKSVNSGAFAAAAKHATHVIAGTEYITNFLHRQHGIESAVIADCIASPIVPYEPTDTLNLLWFGNGANLEPLIKEIPAINRLFPNRLRVVSNRTVKGATCRPWSIQEVDNSLKWADVALFPTGKSVYYQAKGLNRYYEAIAAAVWPAKNASAIDMFLDDRNGIVRREIFNRQEYLRTCFTPYPIATQWLNALNSCAST